MIIVNQDKTEIINFNKVENIYVSGRYISIYFGLNDNEVIGQYSTEERAKEILEEIIKCYANTEQYKCLSGMPNCAYEEKVNVLNKLAENAVIYEMPQE